MLMTSAWEIWPREKRCPRCPPLLLSASLTHLIIFYSDCNGLLETVKPTSAPDSFYRLVFASTSSGRSVAVFRRRQDNTLEFSQVNQAKCLLLSYNAPINVKRKRKTSPDVEIFDCRLARKRLTPNMCFPLLRFTHAPYGLKRSGSHGGQWEQAKAEWISLFCLQISFVLGCFWSIEPVNIMWYQSKRK